MASIHKEVFVDAPPEQVWEAVRDVGAIPTRLARGFVTDTRLEGDSRLVTFADGTVVRERIVDVDDRTRRVAYAAVGWRATHHHASMQVFGTAGGAAVSCGSPTSCRTISQPLWTDDGERVRRHEADPRVARARQQPDSPRGEHVIA